jgi:hypothetical protein
VTRTAGVCGDNFAAKRSGAAEIGAEQRAPAVARDTFPQREANAVADEIHGAFAGCWGHGWNWPFHLKILNTKT